MLSTLFPKVLYPVVALAALATPIARGEPAKPISKPEAMALIETVVKENRANFAKIKSFRLEFKKSSGGKSNLPLPNCQTGTKNTTTAHGLLLRRGDWFRSDYRTNFEFPDQSFRVVNHQMAVLNDSEFFCVVKTETGASAASYEHYSLEDRSSLERDAERSSEFAHPYRHGFEGDYPYNISDRLAKWVDQTEWTVTEEKSGDDHFYHVTSVWENTERRTVTFNARKGYLITSVQRDDTRGNKLLDITVIPAQVNGIWVPQEVDEMDSQNGTFMHLSTVHAEINQTISDSEFQSEKVEFDRSNVRLARFPPGISRPTAMVYRDDRWIPEEFLNREPKQ